MKDLQDLQIIIDSLQSTLDTIKNRDLEDPRADRKLVWNLRTLGGIAVELKETSDYIVDNLK